MTKKELFKKYSINESHSKWDDMIDNWMSVEIYRIMHNGNLPPKDDMSVGWITEFLDKINEHTDFYIELRKRKFDDFGSLYLTAKRLIYPLADEIINQQQNHT